MGDVMKKVAVVLSGCGVQDGSEIHEAVACLLALQRAGAHYQCVAPNINQTQVVNHVTKEAMHETRQVLIEAARIARGDIHDISNVNSDDFSAAVYPGGFGAATNLCDFATKGADCTIEKHVLHFAQAMAKAGKPQAFACIAPVMIAKIYGPGVRMTIGHDANTQAVMKAMGNVHQEASANEIVVDEQHKVVSTPAYMEAKNIAEVFDGIDKMVKALMRLSHIHSNMRYS